MGTSPTAAIATLEHDPEKVQRFSENTVLEQETIADAVKGRPPFHSGAKPAKIGCVRRRWPETWMWSPRL
jgi:hypothetical protein